VARWIVRQPELGRAAIMVPRELEGPIIAEMTVMEPAPPQRILVRPGKLLTQSDWLGNFKLRFASAAALAEELNASPLGAVLMVDSSNHWREAPDLMLREALLLLPAGQWRESSFRCGSTLVRALVRPDPPLAARPDVYAYFQSVLSDRLELVRQRKAE
jgi:hypothetical protein